MFTKSKSIYGKLIYTLYRKINKKQIKIELKKYTYKKKINHKLILKVFDGFS